MLELDILQIFWINVKTLSGRWKNVTFVANSEKKNFSTLVNKICSTLTQGQKKQKNITLTPKSHLLDRVFHADLEYMLDTVPALNLAKL